MTSTLYSRLPIDTSNAAIRTLTVHPSDDREAPIICSLNIASLNDDCDFEALSYVWHEPSLADIAPVAISVNGHDFTPTPNLFSALQHLRLSDKARKLWVDAICINQDDLDERSAQVPLMARIYTSAQAVAVWLGPSNDDIDKYARLEPQMAANIRLIKDAFSEQFGNQSEPATPGIVTKMEKLWLDKAPMLSDISLGHHSLTRNEYWSRMWTYQECCLPAASRVFYCGYNFFTWEQVGSELMLHHVGSLFDSSRGLETERARSGGEPYLETERYLHLQSSTSHWGGRDLLNDGSTGVLQPDFHGSPVSLEENLLNTRARMCKNPLDRFYALYGLVDNSFFLPTVDYTKDVETVSTEVARHLLFDDGAVSIFDKWDYGALRAPSKSSEKVWPSWVPAFRRIMSDRHNYPEGVQASTTNKAISVSQDLSTITILGKSFGQCKILARFCSSTVDDIELFARSLGKALSSLTTRPEPKLFRERLERLIKEILILQRDSEESESLMNTLMEMILNRYHFDGLERPDEANSSPMDVRLLESEIDWAWRISMVGDATEAQVMFITEDLHLGFSNAHLRDGDIAARLGDQEGSCVLRRCETENPRNPFKETVSMVGPSMVRHLPLIWDDETGDRATWFENMTADKTLPVVFTIR